MYYHYFKVIAESDTFAQGLNKIMNDELSEYPKTLNACSKYTLMPEVSRVHFEKKKTENHNISSISAGFNWIPVSLWKKPKSVLSTRMLAGLISCNLTEPYSNKYLNGTEERTAEWHSYGKSFSAKLYTQSEHLLQVERKTNLQPAQSCEGLVVPMNFYLEAVWFSATLTITTLFLYATYLCNSICGGLIATLSFFLNHAHCTRVQWSPSLRETFGYPLLLCQMYIVSVVLAQKVRNVFGNLQCSFVCVVGSYMWLLLQMSFH